MNKKFIAAGILASLVMLPVAHAKIITLTINNKTSAIIEAFYASPPGTNEWEEDLLGDLAIDAGAKHTVRFDDARNLCQYDLRFEFRGQEFEPMEDTQNLCEVSLYEVTE